jgi:hypothetical protein
MAELSIRQATAEDAGVIADLIALNDPRDLVSEISRDERRNRFHEYSRPARTSRSSPRPGATSSASSPSRSGTRSERDRFRHDVHKPTAQVMSHNVAAVALLEQHGFAAEGYLVNQFRRKAGGAADAVLLARTT